MITEFVDPGLAVKSGLFMLGLVRGWTGTLFRWWRPHYELLGVGVPV